MKQRQRADRAGLALAGAASRPLDAVVAERHCLYVAAIPYKAAG
jgi:hypothetical protein